MEQFEIAHHRFGYGPRIGSEQSGDARRLLLDQLERFDPKPAALHGLPSSLKAIEDYFSFRKKLRDLKDSEGGVEAARKERRALRQKYIDAAGIRAQIAIDSASPMAERLTHFWANHFTVSVAKNQVLTLAPTHEFEAIRPHLMGKFSDMLVAAVLHPAMLVYLDQFNAIGPNSLSMQRRVARGRAKAGEQVNENLAREVLELHTLGVDGGYRQPDIIELAKALTGWSVPNNRNLNRVMKFANGSIFVIPRHEPGPRTVLGKKYAANGANQARHILTQLANHPSTARHIASKMARHFTSDVPDAALVNRLEEAFLDSGGDLPTLYRALIDAPECWESPARKFRQPWEWLLAIHRGTNIPVSNGRRFERLLRDFGQPVWGPPSPAGYDDEMPAWAGPDALMRRVNAANAIARQLPARDAGQLAQNWFPQSLSDATREAIARAESPQQALALLLVSPEMMRR